MSARLLWVSVAVLGLATVGCDCSRRVRSAALSVDPVQLQLAPSASGTVIVSVDRGGHPREAVSIAAADAPATFTVGSATISADADTAELTVTATPNAELGSFTIALTGTAQTFELEPVALEVVVIPTSVVSHDISGEAANDQLGDAIALSNDGSRIIVGARFNDGAGVNAGHARVFQKMGADWVQLGADLDGEAAEDRFGGSVDISGDGAHIAVGSYLNDGNGSASGTVRVFDWSGTTWEQRGADIDGPRAGIGHGWAVAISDDGRRLVVGSPAPNSVNGAAYAYEWSATAWVPLGQPIQGDHELGHAVDISSDGKRIAVSSSSAQSSDGYPGQVQVFGFDGTDWALLGGPLLGEANNDAFGSSVSLSADGSMLAVGAPTNDGAGMSSGQVRVFRFEAGAWVQVGADLDGPSGSNLGTSVSLSSDGTRVIAGAPTGAGLSHVYQLAGGAWLLLTAPDLHGDRAGSGVTISGDGHTIAVGAVYADSRAANDGVVRVYSLPSRSP